MISGCSAAFGKGNGPTKVILSHSTTTPSINITRLYLLPALYFIAFWKIGIGLLLCRGCRGKLRNRLKTNITRIEFNTVYYFLLFMSSCPLPFVVKYQTTIVLLLRNVGGHPKEERNC